jgi:non-ribosomal peptide synthetase component F
VSEGLIFWGLDLDVSAGLDRLGREAAATYYMVRLAVLATQLAIESGERDLVLGTYATGRRLVETQAMLGWFSNLVTLRLRLEADLSFRQVLERVRSCVINTSPHTDLPYDGLAQRLAEEGIATPVIRLIYNPTVHRPPRLADLGLEVMRRRFSAMPWEFSIAPDRARESSECEVAFDARIHDPLGVRLFLERFQSLAGAVCAEPDRPVEEVWAPPSGSRAGRGRLRFIRGALGKRGSQ